VKVFCLGWKNALGALATHNKMMYSKTAKDTNRAKKLGNLHTMQQSNKAMFLKNSRTRPREFYRFTALMHSSLTQILKSANLHWKFADLSSPITYSL
jgi:hypothetical protein